MLRIRHPFDLLLADLNLPDGFFLDWVIEKGQRLDQIPAIIISSSDDYEVLASCFEWGASDYLIKPVKPNDLRAKIAKGLGSFTGATPASELAEILEDLTSIERKIFEILHEKVGSFVSREEIIPRIWKKVVVHPKTFDVHLSNLRKKLTDRSWEIRFEDAKGWKLQKP